MDRVQITTAQNVGIEFQAAGVGDRAVAALIDYGILGAYLMSSVLLAEGFDAIDEGPGSRALLTVLLIPYFIYFPISEIFFDGQSIGKRMRHLKVARLDGSAPSLGDYIIRALFRLIEIDMTAGMLAVLTLFIRGQGQRLGDLAAKTTVLKLAPAVTLKDTVYSELDANYQPVLPEAALLSDQDVTLAKEVLDSFRQQIRHRNKETAVTIGHKIKATLEGKMGIASPLPPDDFLETVIRDYNYLKSR